MTTNNNKKVLHRRTLADMPFDQNGDHATGYWVWLEGEEAPRIEYCGAEYEDAPNCSYSDERDEEEWEAADCSASAWERVCNG